jgi:hypothetical protein
VAIGGSKDWIQMLKSGNVPIKFNPIVNNNNNNNNNSFSDLISLSVIPTPVKPDFDFCKMPSTSKKIITDKSDNNINNYGYLNLKTVKSELTQRQRTQINLEMIPTPPLPESPPNDPKPTENDNNTHLNTSKTSSSSSSSSSSSYYSSTSSLDESLSLTTVDLQNEKILIENLNNLKLINNLKSVNSKFNIDFSSLESISRCSTDELAEDGRISSGFPSSIGSSSSSSCSEVSYLSDHHCSKPVSLALPPKTNKRKLTRCRLVNYILFPELNNLNQK